MKYAVCIDTMSEGNLIRKDIKIMKATDATVLRDAMVKIVAMGDKANYKRYTSRGMGLHWDHFNNSNGNDRGCFRVFKLTSDNENGQKRQYVVYYRRIRDTDMIKVADESDGDDT